MEKKMTINQLKLCNTIASYYGITKRDYQKLIYNCNGYEKGHDNLKFKQLDFPLPYLGTEITLVHSELSYSSIEPFLDFKKFQKLELFEVMDKYPLVVFNLGKWIMVATTDEHRAINCIQLVEDKTVYQFSKLKDYLPP